MITRKTPNAFFNLLVALLIVGAANHCLIEESFASISKSAQAINETNDDPSHGHSQYPHNHQSSQDPHEHGEPCPMTAIRFESITSNVLHKVEATESYCFLTSYACYAFGEKVKEFDLPFAPHGRRRIISIPVSCLTAAAQAPPI